MSCSTSDSCHNLLSLACFETPLSLFYHRMQFGMRRLFPGYCSRHAAPASEDAATRRSRHYRYASEQARQRVGTVPLKNAMRGGVNTNIKLVESVQLSWSSQRRRFRKKDDSFGL